MGIFVLCSSSDILAEERQVSQDLVQSSKKDQEFRSIFQHVQNAQLKRCPSELFAQHIVTIVHHIKGESCLLLLSTHLVLIKEWIIFFFYFGLNCFHTAISFSH